MKKKMMKMKKMMMMMMMMMKMKKIFAYKQIFERELIKTKEVAINAES